MMSSMKSFRMTTLVLAMAALGVSSVFAQNSVPDPNAWVTNGAVCAIARSGDITYIGGQFTYVGPNTGYGVPLSTATAQPVVTYPRVNGGIKASIPDGSGGWYIGGAFTQAGTMRRNNIAHILANGTVDAVWNPNAESIDPAIDASVVALAVSGTTIYAGGYFTSIGGQPRNRIAALDATTGLATDWNPVPNASSCVLALAVSGSTVYAGGQFGTIGGQTRICIAALDATTGFATDWNPNAHPSDYVLALAVSGRTIYVGGSFSIIGGQTRNRIAALDATTGLATDWNPNADSTVRTLAVSGTTLYAGGDFSNIGGQMRIRIAALDTRTGLATAWNPSATGVGEDYSYVDALAVSGTKVYAGGSFSTMGGQARNNIVALNATTGLATAWNPNAQSAVHTLAVSQTTVYAGGGLLLIGGQARNNIAALDATGVATAWNPNATGGPVKALAVSGTTVFAGGWFTSIGGQTRIGIVALDVATGLATAWNPDVSESNIYALAVSGTTVYVGGHFSSIGGQARSSIAALDATTGLATARNPGAWGGDFGPYVRALAVSATTIYAGGEFTLVGGQRRNCIAALDTMTGLATAWNPNAQGNDGMTTTHVDALAVSGTTVYAAGHFLSIGGQTRSSIAGLDASTGLATAWNPDPSGGEYGTRLAAFAISGAMVYAGGAFTSIGGQARNNIAALDATTGLATAWNPNAADYVRALAVSDTTVYVGGEFTSIGEDFQPYYAQFDIPPSPPTASITLDDPSVTGLDAVHFSVNFNEPLFTPLTPSDVSLIPGSLAGSIAVSNTDPDYTVTVTLSDPVADGTVGITIPVGAVSDLDGYPYAGGVSPLYTIWNGALPVAGLAGMAVLLGLLTIASASKMQKK